MLYNKNNSICIYHKLQPYNILVNISMADKIKKYYLLCTVRMRTKAHNVDERPDKKLPAIFTKKEINLFLRTSDGHYIAREIVVGGSIERLPIVVI